MRPGGETDRAPRGARWTACAALLAALAAGPPSLGDAPTVTAALDREMVYVGEAVSLTITIEGAKVSGLTADLPAVPGLRIEGPSGPSMSSFTSIVNGRVTERITTLFQCRVTCLRAGSYRIPGFPVTFGKEHRTVGPLRLEVTKPPEDRRIFLRASVDKSDCYPREPVLLTYKLYFSKPIRDHAFSIPILKEAKDLHPEIVPPPKGRPRVDAALQGYRGAFPAERGSETLEGKGYHTWTLRFRLYPRGEGSVLVIPAATAAAELVLGEKLVRRRDWFGITRQARVPETATVRAASGPLTVRVREFPAEGRPDGFDGLTGDFTLSVQADRSQVKVGDPILLRIRVQGQGILEDVRRPVLSRLPEFAGFKIDDSLAPGEIEEGSNAVVFEQKIRARSDDVQAIPPVPLAYFNFVTGKYEIARSEAIPLDVLPTNVVTAADIEGKGGGGEVRPYVEKSKIQEKKGGLHANYLYLDALVDQRVDLSLVWLSLLAPAATLLLALGVRVHRIRSGDPAAARARGARRRGLRAVERARAVAAGDAQAFYEALSRAIHHYFTDRFALGKGEITPVEIARLREEGRVSPECEAEARLLLEACDGGRFAAGAGAEQDRGDLVRRARALIERLEGR